MEPAMNVDVTCPNCGTLYTVRRELLGKRTKCTKCGNAFVIAEGPTAKSAGSAEAPPPSAPNLFPEIKTVTGEPAAAPQLTAAPVVRASPVPQPAAVSSVHGAAVATPRFPALQIVARICEVLAAIMAGLAVLYPLFRLTGMSFARRVGEPTSAFIRLIVEYGVPIFFLLTYALMFLYFAQLIRLGLQIEKNTRETHRACRELADHLGGIEREHQ
jgi:predicted Zn finger-like uncharacterized protein